MHSPDKWVILKVAEDLYKVLGGWQGGYLDGDSWRLSSGIVKIEDDGDFHLIHNHSGSIYKCHKDCEGMTMEMNGIYIQAKERHPEIECILFDDYVKLN